MPDFMQEWWFMGLMCLMLFLLVALIPLGIYLIVRSNSRRPRRRR